MTSHLYQVTKYIFEKPNKPENTVVFSIAEAKDYKGDIALCVEGFKAQIEYFKKVKWQDK